jgi:aminopeptidase N
VHNDGDGTTEGWFRANGGSFVTTEPVGTEDWMPLNDYPSAKPTYDFYDTVNADKTTFANGDLVSVTHNAPDANFPDGSHTDHWHSAATIASYLVEDSVGNYSFSSHVGSDGITYKQAQDTAISGAQQDSNKAVMDQQQDITDFESQFNGPFPFDTDGVAVGTPPASFEEEMQTMITFAGSRASLGTLYHENMHQWWGDNVTESGYEMTFFKEGMAQLAQYMQAARNAAIAAGGMDTDAGRAAFQASLVTQFNANYARTGSFWSQAPSNPTPDGLFSTSPTYRRPATAYIALWQILGTDRFTKVLQTIQQTYGGGSITERQLEAAFQGGLPNKSDGCQSLLSQFFTQWFDTAYPSGTATEPNITGPGLAGGGFYGMHGGECKNV